MLAQTEQNHHVEKARGPRPTLHFLAEDDEEEQASGALNHVVQRNAGGAQWTWKKLTVVVVVSASQIIQAGNYLFIRKNEAHNMHRKKNDKLVLRKEGNVYVLDVFVKVPSCAAAPIKYRPMEVDAINHVADMAFECSKPFV